MRCKPQVKHKDAVKVLYGRREGMVRFTDAERKRDNILEPEED